MMEPEVTLLPSFPFLSDDPLLPPAEHQRLLRQQPVSRALAGTGHVVWIVTRHADVRQVLTSPLFSRSAVMRPGAPHATVADIVGLELLACADPPEHTRLRKLATHAFSPRRVEELRPSIQAIAANLITAMQAAGPPADFVSGFSNPLPYRVICQMLGIPAADSTRIIDWLPALALDPLREFFADLVRARRADPDDSLMSALIAARDEGERLTESELLDFGVGLLIAGHETTANMLADVMLALLRRQDLLAELRSAPDRIPGAVEELLRYLPFTPGGMLARIATSDTEIGGVVIKAGEAVVPLHTAANHDPAVFGNPGTIEITRSPNPHLSLGHGIHHCLGAQLARLELCESIASLLDRLPALRLADPAAKISWRRHMVVHSMTALPVTW